MPALVAIYATKPIICKLIDFGESRSDVAQTATLCNQRTLNVYRGSPVYMPPEIFNNSIGFSASLTDLKAVDVWALGMVFFMLLNPNLDYPYHVELQNKIPDKPWRAVVGEHFAKSKLPTFSNKYQTQRATDWLIIDDVLHRCLCFSPEYRLPEQEVLHCWEEII